jgi:hypothetical protein
VEGQRDMMQLIVTFAVLQTTENTDRFGGLKMAYRTGSNLLTLQSTQLFSQFACLSPRESKCS